LIVKGGPSSSRATAEPERIISGMWRWPRQITDGWESLKAGGKQPARECPAGPGHTGRAFPWRSSEEDLDLDGTPGPMERTWATSRQEKVVEELRTANGELNDFVYLVSHDLKAVHRGMNLLSHWACGDLTNLSEAEVRAQTLLLGDRIERLDDLVSVMVRYSRIGKGDEPQVIVDLQEVVRDLLGAMEVPPRISVEIEQALPVLRMRRTAVLDIFGCLLGNALRQIDQAEGVIRIGCADEGGSWRVSIRDSGPGIGVQYHPRLFRLFQATPNGHWEDFGVALAMAKKSVEACGGRIGVESSVGEGSTFFFTLPKVEILEPLLVGRDTG
jgi:two-component system, LuxR family, sensor kinase FixL